MTGGALPPALVWPFAVALSALLGSFLNVCISRLPRGESVVLPASHCPGCKTPIRPLDNVPLVSFAVLGGRCRACRAPISWRYPLVEALTVAAGLLVLWRLGPTRDGLGAFVLALVLITVTFTDVEQRLIPDRVTLPGIVAGLLLAPSPAGMRAGLGALAGGLAVGLCWYRWRAPGPDARAEPVDDPETPVPAAELHRRDSMLAAAWGALAGRQLAALDPGLPGVALRRPGAVLEAVDPGVAGCLLAGALFYAIAWGSHAVFRRTGMGGGDVKLAALLGAFLGVPGVAVAIFVGVTAGGLAAVLLLLTGLRRFGEYLSFGPFLALGGIVSALWGGPLLAWYLG